MLIHFIKALISMTEWWNHQINVHSLQEPVGGGLQVTLTGVNGACAVTSRVFSCLQALHQLPDMTLACFISCCRVWAVNTRICSHL